MTNQYNLKKIRKFLLKGFSESELRHFCFDEPDFEDVNNQLPEVAGKDKIVQLILDYAKRKSLIEHLLTWAKELNPAIYEKFSPFYDVTTNSTISSSIHGEPQRASEITFENKAVGIVRKNLSDAVKQDIEVDQDKVGKVSDQGEVSRRGTDLRYEMTLEFEEAVFGLERVIEFSRQEKCDYCIGSGAILGATPIRCPECNGTGEVRQQTGFFINKSTCSRCQGRGKIITNPCEKCNGKGRIIKTRCLSIKIPAGVRNGTQVRYLGEGEDGANGGLPGNLYVVIRVKHHPIFNRDQYGNILMSVKISNTEAMKGGEVEVPTLEGKVKVPFRPGTKMGDTFTLKGKGVPHLDRDGTSKSRGDQIVKFEVW